MHSILKHITLTLSVLYITGNIAAQQPEWTALDSSRIYRSIENAMKNPEKVFRLHLVKVKLKEFPVEIFQFKNLQELILDKNKINEIPDAISELKNLETLRLSHNRIDSIPPALLKLQHLKTLDLSDNIIGSVPENIDFLSNLEYLILWDNPIYYYPNSIGDLQKLKVLDILNNQLNYSTRDRLQSSLPNVKFIHSPPCNCVEGME